MSDLLPIDAGTVERKRGDTKPFRLSITDEDGTAVDLASFSLLLTANTESKPVNEDNQVFQLTGTSPENGKIEFPWTEDQADRTDSVSFDVEIEDAGGIKTTIVTGKFKFSQDITK